MKYFKKKTEKTLVLKYPKIRSYVSLQYHGLRRKRSSIIYQAQRYMHNTSINTHFRDFYDSEVIFFKKLFYHRFFLKKHGLLKKNRLIKALRYMDYRKYRFIKNVYVFKWKSVF